jgi:hypothetical protein
MYVYSPSRSFISMRALCTNPRGSEYGYITIVFCTEPDQGDQIGRIFASWAIDFFGQVF